MWDLLKDTRGKHKPSWGRRGVHLKGHETKLLLPPSLGGYTIFQTSGSLLTLSLLSSVYPLLGVACIPCVQVWQLQSQFYFISWAPNTNYRLCLLILNLERRNLRIHYETMECLIWGQMCISSQLRKQNLVVHKCAPQRCTDRAVF